MSRENLTIRRAIAEELLGCELDENGFAPCPGRNMHNSTTGKRDFRVVLEGVPTGSCFHMSCAGAVEDFNWNLRSRIGKAEANRESNHSASMMGPVSPPPQAPRGPKWPDFDPKKLADFAARCPFVIDAEWLAQRSPVSIPATQDLRTSELVLSALYQPGERVLIFTKEFSQGDFLYHVGHGSYRLADRPGVKASPSPLPTGGPLGVWMLAQPVKGTWEPNLGNRWPDGSPKLGRRHGAAVTAWRYLVLESDLAPTDQWCRALVQLPLPIVAIYTSGSRSIHALARVDARTKEEWDALRNDVLPILSTLGADPATLTAVRLTRLPGALRYGSRGPDGKAKAYGSPQLQRLLYLAPEASTKPILAI